MRELGVCNQGHVSVWRYILVLPKRRYYSLKYRSVVIIEHQAPSRLMPDRNA